MQRRNCEFVVVDDPRLYVSITHAISGERRIVTDEEMAGSLRPEH